MEKRTNNLTNEEQKKIEHRLYKEIERRYDNLGNMCKRLQEDFNNDILFKTEEQDRLDICAILDVFDGNILDLEENTEHFDMVDSIFIIYDRALKQAKDIKEFKEITNILFSDNRINDIDYEFFMRNNVADILKQNFKIDIYELAEKNNMSILEYYEEHLK